MEKKFDPVAFEERAGKLGMDDLLDIRWELKHQIEQLQASVADRIGIRQAKIAVLEKVIGRQILPDMKTVSTVRRRVTARKNTQASIADVDLFYNTLGQRIVKGEQALVVLSALERRVKSSWATEYVEAYKTAPPGINITTGRALVFS